MSTIRALLSTDGFPARWSCGRWSAGLGWLHIVSDLAIFAAYTTIPVTLVYFLVRRRSFEFPGLTLLFASFILACGLGHAFEALIFWHPAYRLAGLLKAFTAAISWATAIATVRIMPDLLNLPNIARLNHSLQEQSRQRDAAEQELRRSMAEARKLALIASRTDNAVILTDPQGRIEWVNEGFSRITGYTADEARGRKPGAFLQGEETDPAVIAFMRDRLAHGESFRVELANYHKSGERYWVCIEVQALRDEAGQVANFMAMQTDITARKQTEQQLRLLQAAVENANDVILITEAEPLDRPGPRVVYTNPAFERVTGYSAAEILGKTPRILQGPGTDQSTLDMVRRNLKGWNPTRVEVLNYAKDGREFWVELNIQPVADTSGWYTHWVSIQRDITQRKLAELEQKARAECEVRDLNLRLEQRIHRLDALRQVDLAISASLDLPLTLGVVLDQVLGHLNADAAAILLVDPQNWALAFSAGKGFRTDAIRSTSQRHGEGLAGQVVAEQRYIAADLTEISLGVDRDRFQSEECFVGYHAVPLTAKGHVRGVLEVFHRTPRDVDREWISFLETLAGHAAIAIDNATLFRDLQRSHASIVLAYDATIEGWARAIDLRDRETEGHSRRVTEMTVMLARSMGVDEADLTAIRRGAMLHDIGKLAIPDSILLKPGKLTEAEWEVMKRHPQYAYDWLAPIAFLRPALEIPHFHHERWDGLGYPMGLAGERIPLAARIFAAVDIWDALRSDRPYRAGWQEGQVIDYLRSISGTHLNPTVVKAFLAILEGKPNADPACVEFLEEARSVMLEYQLQLALEANQRVAAERADYLQKLSRLEDLAYTDDLTGLRNRRFFRQTLETAFASSCSGSKPLSVVLLDLDHFKSFNDEHGHHAGDEALIQFGAIVKAVVRPDDLVARYGGEEFAVLLPGADCAAGLAIAERIRSAIVDHPWDLRPLTASLGVATLTDYELTGVEIVVAADVALYYSKRTGRNRVSHILMVEHSGSAT